MNKIYKVIWNATLGTWVAVSELAKGKTKSSKVTGIVGAATVAFMVTFSPEAVANLAVCGGTLPVGYQSTGTDATCYGAEAKATIGGAIAIGDNQTNKAIAIGNDNLAIMSGATATSGDSTSRGDNIAIGHEAKAITSGGAQRATAIGSFAQATAGNATALGGTAKASGVSSVAVGYRAQATATEDVVIGSGSSSIRNTVSGQTITNSRGTGTVNFGTGDTSLNTSGVVVGNNSTIAGGGGVAVGTKNIIDSGVNSLAIGMGNKATGTGYNIALGIGNLSQGVASIGIGVATKAAANATAIGRLAYAEGDSSIAVGRIATSNGVGSIALGTASNASANSSVAIGQNANVTQVYGTAIGSGGTTVANATQATGAGATAIGGNATAGAKALSADSIAIGGESVAGTATNVNAIAIGKGAQATGNQSISIGVGNKVSGNNSGAIGDPSIINGANSYSVGNNNTIGSTTTDAFALGNNVYLGATSAGVDTTSVTGTVAIGSTATSSALRGTALGYGANVTANGGVALGSGSVGGASSGSAFLTGAGAPTLGAVGVGGRRIQNLADGSAATDAVTVAQLDKSHDDTNARLVGALGAGSGATYVAGTNTYTAPTNIGGTGKTTIDDAIKASKRTVVSGTNATVVPVTTADGSITYTVNADGTTVSASPSSSVTVTPGTKNANNVTDYAVDLSATAKSDIAKGVAAKTAIDGTGLTFTGDGGTTTGVKKLGDTVAVTGDSNITTTAKQGQIDVALNKDLKGLTSVETVDATDPNKVTTTTAGGTTVKDGTNTTIYGANGLDINNGAVTVGKDGLNAGGVTVGKDGINANDKIITGVGEGSVAAGSKDAVTGGQVDTIKTDLESQIAKAGQDGKDATDNVGQSTANALGGGAKYDSATGNISAPKYTVNGVDKTNVGDAISALDAGWNLASNGTGSAAIKAGDTVDIGTANNEANLTVVKKDNTIDFSLNKDLVGLTSVETTDGKGNTTIQTATGTTVKDGTNTTVYGANGLNINNGAVTVGKDGLNAGGVTVGKDGINANDKIITGVGEGSVAAGSKDAVTGGQVDTIKSALEQKIADANGAANAGWTVKANGTSQVIKPTKAVEFAGSSNIDVNQVNDTDGNAKLSVKLKDDITVNSINAAGNVLNANGLTVGNTSVTSGGVYIVGGPSLSSAGINAGNKVISNVAAGVNKTDAVNKDQFDTAINNVMTQASQNNDQAAKYDKNTDGTINKNQLTLEGENGTIITNVKNGNVATGSKDAVNGGQLAEVRDNLQGQITQNSSDITNIKNDINNGALGVVKQKDPKGEITVGGDTGGTTVNVASKDGNRVVTGVANGKATNDAVNVGQLDTVAKYLGGGAGYDNITQSFTAPSYAVGDKKYDNVGSAVDALNQADQALNSKINNVSNKLDDAFRITNNKIDDVEKKANAGIAAAMALESAPYVPGKYTYAAGAAYHGGENAVGVTLRKTADSGRWSITGGVAAASEGDPSVRIGISGVID